jgi:hypothetical protein
MDFKERKNNMLKKYRKQTKKTNLFIVNSLVGDEIQRCRIKVRRGWNREGGSFMLLTFLMDIHLGASSLTIYLWVTLKGT